MFEAAEVGNTIDKATYKKAAVKIREALLNVQRELAGSKHSVVVIVAGVEGTGKPELVNLLLEWMDARGIETHSMWNPSDEERERPPYWRFWRVLPPRGRMAVFFDSWYTSPIINRVFKRTDQAEFDQELSDIADFEEMLVRENVIVLKFWMHVSKSFQKMRLKELEADKRTRWRVNKTDWQYFDKYDSFRESSEHALRKTSTSEAPWHIVEASDERYRTLTVAKTILETLSKKMEQSRGQPAIKAQPDRPKPARRNLISHLDNALKLGAKEYGGELDRLYEKINRLTRKLYEKRRSLICVFEGPDAAGKGGAIRRLIGAIDARQYTVHSVAAPTDEERVRPYLWRFWRNIPRLGRVTIFDRSWYGRVLVERIEGFCAPEDWKRAYSEINAFEEQVARFGIHVVKFWLDVTADEQLRRFNDREITPYKQYKLTEEDWRNREKFDAYTAAACDMIEKTSTEVAPWILVEANDKYWARIKILKTVCKTLEKTLEE